MQQRVAIGATCLMLLAACEETTSQPTSLAGSRSGTKATMPISYSDAHQLAQKAATMPANSMAFSVVELINAANAGLPSLSCSGGIIMVDHIDNDADLAVSTNDLINADFRGCGKEQLNGTVEVTIINAVAASMSIRVMAELRSAAQQDISSTLLGVVENDDGYLVAVFNGQINTHTPGEDSVYAKELNLELSHDGSEYAMGFDYVLSIDGPAGADSILVDTASELTGESVNAITGGEIRLLGQGSRAIVAFEGGGAELNVDYDADGTNDSSEEYRTQELTEGFGY